ncbi:MAG: hypothetical protein WB495_01210, partial [Xanthobacteraceae bacterium]
THPPTTPSLPMMAVSICSPDFMTVSIDTIPLSGKIDVLDWLADRVKEVAPRHPHFLEVGSERIKIVRAKPVQEPVLAYVF